MARTLKELEERVAELERELAEMKAAARSEQHFHYHYPPQPLPRPVTNPWPYRYYPGWSPGLPQTGGGQTWTLNATSKETFNG